MSLIPYSPALRALSRWPDIWDDDFFSTSLSTASNNLDLYETDDAVIVKANVAGVPSENVDLTFEKGTLWIKAEATAEKDSDEKSKKHYSKSSWSYSYKVAVPGTLDHTAEPDATVKDGVLTVSFKKSEHTKPKKLTVKSE
jgi:HSP20 family protein